MNLLQKAVVLIIIIHLKAFVGGKKIFGFQFHFFAKNIVNSRNRLSKSNLRFNVIMCEMHTTEQNFLDLWKL